MNSGKSISHDYKNIIRRFIAGERDAFDDLYNLHAAQLLAFLAARVSSLHLAEDLSQTVWIRVWEHRASFDGKHFRAWMFAIGRNVIIDAGRKATRRGATASIEDAAEQGRNEDPSESMSRKEELAALKSCLKSIGGVFIEALVRTHLIGESPECLADQINMKRGTIDTRVNRGKQLLRECLEKKLK